MLKSRVQEATALHKRGYNCAQAVACTYCGLLNMSEADALRALEAFGAGIAASGATCGALCGLLILAGHKQQRKPERPFGPRKHHKTRTTTYDPL